MFRIRSILGFLDFARVQALLPEYKQFQIDQRKSLPAFAYKYPFNPSIYGLFMESLIRAALTAKLEEWESAIMACFVQLIEAKCPFSFSDKAARTYFFSIYHFAQTLKDYGERFTEPELSYGKISGHPDLVAEHIIFDVKTTLNFSSMMRESLLQIFAYGALALANRQEIAYVGVILPVQKKILTAPIVGWDFQPYLKLLVQTAQGLDPEAGILLHLCARRIGSHISKDKSLYGSLSSCRHPVAQIFLSSPRKKELTKVPEAELEKIVKLTLPFFVHAPYYLNIAKENDYQLGVLEHEFSLAKRMKARGVVIHLGSNPEQKEGLELAHKNLATLLSYASPETPLLLETQAGEGNDLFVQLEELVELYQTFKGDSRLRLCVDTCHVWAAGYNPYTYLQRLLEAVGSKSIALIHFNDCQAHRGSRKDRHAPYGRGYIGELIMGMVFKLACENSIPMVTE